MKGRLMKSDPISRSYGVRRSFVEGEFRHRIMFSISRPKCCPAGYGGGRNQGIAQFNCMSFSIPPQVFSSKATHSGIGGYAHQSLEQSFQRLIFRCACACPEFGDADRRDEDQRVGSAEFDPPRNDGPVAAPGDLDEYVGIDEDGQRPPGRSSLEPIRSCRTSSLLSGESGRDFRIPTKLCIAAIRVSRLPI